MEKHISDESLCSMTKTLRTSHKMKSLFPLQLLSGQASLWEQGVRLLRFAWNVSQKAATPAVVEMNWMQ